MSIPRIVQVMRDLGEVRYHPVEKRVRVRSGETVIADTFTPFLIWEPRRIVPSYAIPAADIRSEIHPVAAGDATEAQERPVQLGDGPPLLDPSTEFGFHTSEGTRVEIEGGAGYRLADPDLAHLVVLDFDAFDWFEEDEPIFGHPRDPFSRIDLRSSSRHVRIERDGVLLAESTRPLMLFETMIPARFYLPRADVAAELRESDTKTVCAYKGHATHWHVDALGPAGRDIAWSYETTPPELHQIARLVCFYQERVDVIVDGVQRERPRTPWSEGD